MATPAVKVLYIHIGTPKTGTSALQLFLYDNYDPIRAQGFLYPISILESEDDPKHQSIFSCIYLADKDKFEFGMGVLGSELSDATHTVILSCEGFFHYTHEFSDAAWLLIKRLGELLQCQIRVIIYLRPQIDYVESMYRQYMRNPKKKVNADFGSGMTINEFIKRPVILHNMDYYGSLMKWAEVIGSDNVVVRRYSKNVIEDFMAILNLNVGKSQRPLLRNLSLTREMAELLRYINPKIEEPKRKILIRHMEIFLERNPVLNDKSIMSPSERCELMKHYRADNNMLAQIWLKEDELFPEPVVSEDETWEPLPNDNAWMSSLLSRLSNMDIS